MSSWPSSGKYDSYQQCVTTGFSDLSFLILVSHCDLEMGWDKECLVLVAIVCNLFFAPLFLWVIDSPLCFQIFFSSLTAASPHNAIFHFSRAKSIGGRDMLAKAGVVFLQLQLDTNMARLIT